MTIFITPPFFANVQEKEEDQQAKCRMPSNKKKQSRAAQLAPQPPPTTAAAITSDYDTDTAYHTESQALPVTSPPPNRSPAQLNMLVLRRWYPAITSILAIAPFAVLYSFSPDAQSWDKCDTQGSLFVCQLSPLSVSSAPRYKVIILNRRNPKNFELDLVSTEDIEVTEEFVIIPHLDFETGEAQIYGIWVFRDAEGEVDVRRYIANVILECAGLAEGAGREPVHETYAEEPRGNGQHDIGGGHGYDLLLEGDVSQPQPHPQQQTMTGQSIDLATLFGKPIRQQEQWIPHQNSSHHYDDDPQLSAPTPDITFLRDTNSPAGASGFGSQALPPGSQQNALLNLFKNAKKG